MSGGCPQRDAPLRFAKLEGVRRDASAASVSPNGARSDFAALHPAAARMRLRRNAPWRFRTPRAPLGVSKGAADGR